MKIYIELKEFDGSGEQKKYLHLTPVDSINKQVRLEVFQILEHEHTLISSIEIFIDDLKLALSKISL